MMPTVRFLLLLLLLTALGDGPLPLYAEVHTITVTGEYRMGHFDTRADAKRLALVDAKRRVLGKTEAYLGSTPGVQGLRLSREELQAYLIGILENQEPKHRTVLEGETIVQVEVSRALDPAGTKRLLEALHRSQRARAELIRAEEALGRLHRELETKTLELAGLSSKPEADAVLQQRQQVLNQLEVEQQLARTWVTLAEAEDVAHAKAPRTGKAGKQGKDSPAHPSAGDAAGAEAHRKKGVLLNEQGQYDAAIIEFRAALRLQPSLARSHLGLGYALQGKGNLEEAVTEYRSTIRLQPDDADAHTNLGTALQAKGDLQGAITEYRTALQYQPNDALIHFNLGTALAERGEADEAIREYRKVLRLQPDFAPGHFNLAVRLKAKGSATEAVKEFRDYLNLAPNTPANQKWIEEARAHIAELEP